MKKKIIITLSCMVLTGIISASAFVVHARDSKKAANKDLNEIVSYEEILHPYQNIFNEFNSAHGTTYGFMTDEQLELHHMDKEEYLKNVVDEYGNMTTEEFRQILEEAYANENRSSAGNLPYFQDDSLKGKKMVYRCSDPTSNGDNIFVLEEDK